MSAPTAPRHGTSTSTDDRPDPNAVASRLLRSSAKKSYDPAVDIDWEAPLDPTKLWVPEHRVSLYGTDLWERMTPEQRVELGKHEACSVASVGLWFEVLLMQRLLKDFYAEDPTSPRAQFALTEVADECRHSQMFARMVSTAGVEPYGPRENIRQLGKLFSVVNRGPAAYASILVAEEVLDRLQREQANDENVQPLMRQVNRIHILEEARHVSFARDEVTRGIAALSRAELYYQRWICAYTSMFVVRSLINPKVYTAVGIDPAEGRRAALGNPHHQEMIRWAGEKIMAFLSDAGMVGFPGMYWWKQSMLVPGGARR
jgi:hypothetical protein